MSEPQQSEIQVYSTVWCPDCKRAKMFFGEQRIAYQNHDIEQDSAAMALVEKINGGKHIIPTILFPDGTVLVEPSNAELAAKLGLQTRADHTFYDVVVVGGGPAGLTAALYLSREGLQTLVIEQAGLGGQAGTSNLLDNFPGFDEGISGAEFGDRLARQARRFGAEILQAQSVQSITHDGQYVNVSTSDGHSYGAKAALLATGARYRRLGVPGEDELIGANIHFCATCDGAFYKGKRLLVIGGGNSGFEEGIFLTRFASQVDIVDHNPRSKASAVLQEKVAKMAQKMSVTLHHRVKEFRVEDNHLSGVLVEDLDSGEIKQWNYDGVFVFIGLTPNIGPVEGTIETDARGFVVTASNLMTSIPGLFAAGDVRAGSTKQAASATGEGATAALMIRDYLRQM